MKHTAATGIKVLSLILLAGFLFLYGSFQSANFFGVEPSRSEQLTTTFCTLGALACLIAIPFVVRNNTKNK